MARSDQDLDRLEAAAAAWAGTPWCDNSQTRGRGVCCHLLMRALYVEAGWLPDLEVPIGSSRAARWSNESPILEWMRGAGAQWFSEIAIGASSELPGDTIIMKVGHVPHHMGMVLRGGRVCHVTSTQGVRIVAALNQWRPRLTHIFRPR